MAKKGRKLRLKHSAQKVYAKAQRAKSHKHSRPLDGKRHAGGSTPPRPAAKRPSSAPAKKLAASQAGTPSATPREHPAADAQVLPGGAPDVPAPAATTAAGLGAWPAVAGEGGGGQAAAPASGSDAPGTSCPASTGAQADPVEPGQAGVAAKRNACATIPFSADDTILLVGEGNFSFAAALATLLGDAELLTATSFDSLEEVQAKYPDAAQHIATVADHGGTVLHGVDATRLDACKALRKGQPAGTQLGFTRVVFNFPHAGAGIKDQDRNILSNQRLLASFFASVRPLLSTPSATPVFTTRGPLLPVAGQVLVTLKSGLPYDDWDIAALAKAAGFWASGCRPFHPATYPGYEHRRTIGWDASKEGNLELEGKACKTWIFQDRKKVLAAKAGARARSKAEKKAQQQAAKRSRDSDTDDSDVPASAPAVHKRQKLKAQKKGKGRAHSDSDSD